MKIPLKDFKLTSSIARNIAENAWNRGGTHSYKCNRRGAYYFSCSAHGGYVVDSAVLFDEERGEISKYISADNLRLLVQDQDGEKMVIGLSYMEFANSGKVNLKWGFNARFPNPVWIDYPVFLFEEDCDWTILERMTNIRSDGFEHLTSERRGEIVNETFGRYFSSKV